jgi:hypothetical protein
MLKNDGASILFFGDSFGGFGDRRVALPIAV